MTDHYATLGVSYGSEDVVIQAAYRALMRKYHPDTNASAEAARRATEINAAFSVLGNPQRRAAYDAAQGAHKQLSIPVHTTHPPATHLERQPPPPVSPHPTQERRKRSIVPALVFFLVSLAITSPTLWKVAAAIFFPPTPKVIHGPPADRVGIDDISGSSGTSSATAPVRSSHQLSGAEASRSTLDAVSAKSETD